MKYFFQKFIIIAVGFSIALNPLFVLVPQKVKADDNTTDKYASNPDSEDDSGSNPASADNLVSPVYPPDFNDGIDPSKVTGLVQAADVYKNLTSADYTSILGAATSQSFNNLAGIIDQYSPGATTSLTFDDIFTNANDPRIILTAKDKNAVKALSCLSSLVPNFSEDYTALYANITKDERSKVDSAVTTESSKSTPRYTTKEQYFNFLKLGGINQTSVEYLANKNFFNQMTKDAEKSFSDDKLKQAWQDQAAKIVATGSSDINIDTLTCVTGLNFSEIEGYLGNGPQSDGAVHVSDAILKSLEALVLDIRVINTLVYLVTPKDQGGAGHWRIKAARILQDSEKSKESDAVIQSNNQTNPPTLTTASANGSAPIQCDDTMTAAECGSQQNQGTAIVSDADGTQYSAFFQNMDSELDNNRNISAHSTGQAVDISEVDDLRCTLVKMHRIGKDNKTAQPIKPIKLAWQTTDGYEKSGGSANFDQMQMMKDLAKQSVVDLLSSMNENITDYSGDLSKANFNDLVGILGQSLLTQVVTSGGQNLKGYDISNTLQSLGTVYLADYFSLPREIFQGANIKNLEDFKFIIGRSAIEKKLNLPYGSLDSLDLAKTNSDITKQSQSDLVGLLTNIGQRKVEHEMGLDPHDLDQIFQTKLTSGKYLLDNRALGRIVIEDDLNLPKGSWPASATGFNDLKNYISDARVSVLRVNPGYIDSTLHLDPGTTKSFMQGGLNSENYAEKVGTTRYNNTTAGLRYFQMNNSAYALPGPTAANPGIPDTWKDAVGGSPEALKTIGVYTLGRLLGQNTQDVNLVFRGADNKPINILPGKTTMANVTKIIVSSTYGPEKNVEYNRSEFGQFVFREWLWGNINERINAADSCSKPLETNSTVSVTYSGQQVYNGPVSLGSPTKTDINNTLNNNCRLYQNISISEIDYTDENGHAQVKTGNIVATQEVSEAAAMAAGLERFDMRSIMGFNLADGRAVFERIGAKLLYYAIANKALSPEEKAKIDLTNTDPTLNVNSDDGTVAFYLSRALKVQDSIKKIKNNWDAVKATDPEVADITTNVNKTLDDLKSIYSDADLDLTKISKIAGSISLVAKNLSDIKKNLVSLKERYSYQELNGANGTVVNAKIEQINQLIFEINDLILTCSEIMSGHTINSSDSITISQINQNSASRGGSGSSTSSGTSDWQIMLQVFGFISGRTSAEDLMEGLGANAAESELGLPSHSLLYLAQTYEKNGITGVDAFYQSLGQAQIEQELSLPTNYFQGNEIVTKIPKFDKTDAEGNYKNLLDWTKDANDTPLIAADFKSFTGNQTIDLPIDENTLSDYVRYTSSINRDKFKNWQKIAAKYWLSKNKVYQIFDKTLDNVVTNISSRGLTDGIRSAENDLLLRLGFPTGIYSALKANSPVAWQTSNARALEIDTKLGLPAGYTKMLFTGDKTITSKTLSNSQKNQLQASSMNVSINEIEKYIQLINGDLLATENNEYQNGLQMDFVTTNPYADPAVTGTGSSCPINFAARSGFVVNETTITPDSFCYYDKTGRHCFQSREEAGRYWTDHPNDRITNILDDLAVKIAQVTGFTGDSQVTEIVNGLKNFVNDKSSTTIFSDTILKQFNAAIPLTGSSARVDVTKLIFNDVETSQKIPAKILTTLFTRELVDAPLASYKSKVGVRVANRLITTKIFDGLGLNLDPDLFDGGDLYDILTGDYSSLGRIGTTLVDRAMGLPAGTAMLIYTARNVATVKCALTQAGGTIFGQAFGLNYFPVDRLVAGQDTFLSALGEEKIEEALSLPRGTFRVDDQTTNNTIDNLMKNMGIINFVAAFKLPIDLTNAADKQVFLQAVSDILGDQYNMSRNTSPFFQLEKTRQYLSSTLLLSQKSNQGRINLETLLKKLLTSAGGTLESLKVAGASLHKAAPAGASSDISNTYADYNIQVSNFYDQVLYVDTLLGLAPATTTKFLSGVITPSAYIGSVGRSLGLNVAGMKLAEALGFNPDEAKAAVDLATNIQSVFACTGNMHEYPDGNGGTICANFNPSGSSQGNTSNPRNSLYHNWGYLYDNLDQVFHFSIDVKAGLPVGTMSKVMNNPNNAFNVFMEIGANKLDAQYKLDSSKVVSFTGLYRALAPAEINSYETECRAYAVSDVKLDPNELDAKMANAQANLKKALKENNAENQRAAENEIQQIETQFIAFRGSYDGCLAEKRYHASLATGTTYASYAGRIWEWAQDGAAELLSEQLAGLTVNRPGCAGNNCAENIGVQMPKSDVRKMFNGDLRYMEAAAASLGANLVVLIGNSISTTNCNPKEHNGDACSAPVPAGMRITYEEIKLAFFGLPLDQSAQIAAFAQATDYGYKPDPDKHSVGAASCATGTFWNGIMCIAQTGDNQNSAINIQGQVATQYGYSPANVVAARTGIITDIKNYCSEQFTGAEYDNCIKTNGNSYYQSKLNLLDHPETLDTQNNPYVKEVQAATEKAAAKKLKYDMIDIGLWKLDENIYPGFAQAMMDGNTGEKWAALAQYTRNGLVNGHLFGVNFNGIDPTLVSAATGFVAVITAAPGADRQKALNNLTAEKFDSVVNFISDHSEKWLGFKLDKNITGGLITSITTGEWGGAAFSVDGVLGDAGAVTSKPFAGSQPRPTFGGTVVNFGLSKIFSWADKQLGLKEGQSFQVFSAVKDVYKAYSALSKAKAALAAAKTPAQQQAAQQAVNKADAQVTAQLSAAVQIVIGILVDKLLGKAIGEWEGQLDLVPGTLAPVISGAIYEGVAASVNAIGGSTILTSMGPYGWAAIAGMFILQNLLGVYRVEYWCSADGYFPKMGSPNPTKNAMTDVGEFGGKVGWSNLNQIIQNGSVAAAQNKASQLIGDLLQMQYNPAFNDNNGTPTVPTQIMTGRTEDVANAKDMVTTNMCKLRLGPDAQAVFNGTAVVCDAGSKRMGLWQNSQTVAWTHVGF